MKPIIILPPGAMSKEDIKLLNDNDLCVVEAQDPAAVRFVDPLPAQSSRNEMENAAIQLSRKLLNGEGFSGSYTSQGDVNRMFVKLLVHGTALQAGPTREESEDEYFTTEKYAELQRLAAEEARAERAAKKAERDAAKKAEAEKRKPAK